MARPGRPREHDPKADVIRQAITYGSAEEAIESLKSCDVDILDCEARTPLIHAVFEGKMPIAVWLVANGANVNHQDRNGWTALHFAVQEKRRDMIDFLLNHAATVNMKDRHGNTPLWRATFDARGKYDLVTLLLSHKADPTIKNNAGRSPVDFAIQIGDTQLTEILRKR